MNTTEQILQAARKTAQECTGNELRRVPHLFDIYVSFSRDVPQGYAEIAITHIVNGGKFYIFRAVGAE